MSSPHYHKRSECRLCSSRNLDLALPLTPTPLCDAYVTRDKLNQKQEIYPLDVYLCADCGFAQVLDIVSPEAIYLEYTYETKASLGLAEHFASYVSEIIARLQIPIDSFVVDVGSNDGTLLRAFKNKGMQVLGIDPARDVAQKAMTGGIDTLPEFFTSTFARRVNRTFQPAKIVTTNNLYANIDELHDFTEGINEILADDGVWVFESFYLPDLMENMVFDFIYHEHVSCFSVTPMIPFLNRHGLELFDVQRVDTKGGSLRYYVQRKGGPRKRQPSVDQLLNYESERGTTKLQTFKAFDDKIKTAKTRVLKILSVAQNEGKKVSGYGASASSTTLLYHFNLTDKLDYIYDENKIKIGRFSPGCHIPILDPAEIARRKPDYILLLAWRYMGPIMKKNKEFAARGGKFIVPLPEPKVV